MQVLDEKVSLKTVSPLKSPNTGVSVSPLMNKNENSNSCLKMTGTPLRKSTPKSPCAGNGIVPSQLFKVPLNFNSWYDDKSASWEDLPAPLCNLGKVRDSRFIHLSS